MPVLNFLHWTRERGDTLQADGPIMPVEVNVPLALSEWCIRRNIAVPQPISGYALIDTGSSISGIHEAVLEQLGILPIDSIPLSTPAGSGRAFVYPTCVSFPALNVAGCAISRVVGDQLNFETPDGKKIIMLLGRDLLSQFLLVYNGRSSSITLAY